MTTKTMIPMTNREKRIEAVTTAVQAIADHFGIHAVKILSAEPSKSEKLKFARYFAAYYFATQGMPQLSICRLMNRSPECIRTYQRKCEFCLTPETKALLKVLPVIPLTKSQLNA